MNPNFGKKKAKNDAVEQLASVFRIYPNEEQIPLLEKTFGCCRFVWNRLLSDKKKIYQDYKVDVDPLITEYKNEFEWLNEVDSLALSNVLIHLKKALSSFFAKKAKFPKFKSKRKSKPSYTTNFVNGNIQLTADTIKLPKFKDPIKIVIHRPLPDDYKIKNVTVSRNAAGEYYVAIMFETRKSEKDRPSCNPNHIGLDYKMDGLYVDSNGNMPEMPKFYRKSQDKLAKEQAKLHKMKHRFEKIKANEIKRLKKEGKAEEAEKLKEKKVSNNYLKQKKKVGKISTHVKNQRKDFLHKKSKELTDQYDIISVEDINMRAMARRVGEKDKKGKGKKKRWGKAVNDNAFGMFREFLSYKQEKKGHVFIKVDKFYPSSQICNNCGFKNSITKDLDVREIVCPECGSVYDRDINAAKNIDTEGLRIFYKQLGMEPPDVKLGDISSDVVILLPRSGATVQKWMNQEAPASRRSLSGG